MAVLSKRDLVRFTPDSRKDEENPPVYIIAPLGWRERATFESELTRAGAVFYPNDQAVIAAVRECVEELAEDNSEELLAQIDEFAEAKRAEADAATSEGRLPDDTKIDPDITEAYGRIERAVARHPVVSRLLAERRYWLNIAPGIAASLALVDWENVPAKFRRKNGVVPDEVLDAIGSDLMPVGLKALSLMRVGGTEAKN